MTVVAGDTGLLDDGVGFRASRLTVVGGSAVHMAAEATAALARQAAAVLLGAGPAQLSLADGRVTMVPPDRQGRRAEVPRSTGSGPGRWPSGMTGLSASPAG